MSNKFRINLSVFLSETNVFGNVYFAEYFMYQGKARESFLASTMQEQLNELTSKYKLVTAEATHKFKNELLPFEKFYIEVEQTIFKKVIELKFIFKKRIDDSLVGIGKQKIVFVDYKTNKIVDVPKIYLDKLQSK